MSASDLPEPTIDQARQLGEKGSPARESERLLFEAWMGGHCWAIGGTWTGAQYKASDEDGLRVNQQAMLTRMLWAAWRDRGTLADDQLRAYGGKRAREAVEALLSPGMLEVGRKAIEDALIECRDARMSVLARNNGLVIKERDGTPSDTIRMGPETALGIGIRAMLASAPTPGDKT